MTPNTGQAEPEWVRKLDPGSGSRWERAYWKTADDQPIKVNDGFGGWKFHISATTKEATTKLFDLAKCYGVLECKAWSDPRDLQDVQRNGKPEKQYGKTFVVYTTECNINKDPIDWEKFISEADQIVKEHGGAGMPVRGDNKIPGSAAVYYRNDESDEGHYIRRDAASLAARVGELPLHNRFNPDGAYNPFKSLRIGDAKKWPEDACAMLQAIYTGDLETAQRLHTTKSDLCMFEEPIDTKRHTDLLEQAKRLAQIEFEFLLNGKPIHEDIIRLAQVLSDVDISQYRPPVIDQASPETPSIRGIHDIKTEQTKLIGDVIHITLESDVQAIAAYHAISNQGIPCTMELTSTPEKHELRITGSDLKTMRPSEYDRILTHYYKNPNCAIEGGYIQPMSRSAVIFHPRFEGQTPQDLKAEMACYMSNPPELLAHNRHGFTGVFMTRHDFTTHFPECQTAITTSQAAAHNNAQSRT